MGGKKKGKKKAEAVVLDPEEEAKQKEHKVGYTLDCIDF